MHTPRQAACAAELAGRRGSAPPSPHAATLTMREDATAVDVHEAACPSVEVRPHVRLLHGMRRPANWLQLVRFGIVGGVGFVVNLAVYTLFVHPWGSTTASPRRSPGWSRSLNNFVLNRHWTFDARGGSAHRQAVRFLARQPRGRGLQPAAADRCSSRSAGIAKIPAQAIAVAAADAAELPGQQALELSGRG